MSSILCVSNVILCKYLELKVKNELIYIRIYENAIDFGKIMMYPTEFDSTSRLFVCLTIPISHLVISLEFVYDVEFLYLKLL